MGGLRCDFKYKFNQLDEIIFERINLADLWSSLFLFTPDGDRK